MTFARSFLFILLLPFLSAAQQDYHRLDDKYTPPPRLYGAPQKGSEYSGVPLSGNVKFNLFLLTRSIAALHYETRLPGNVTAQGGLGFTFNRDYVQYIMGDLSEDDDPASSFSTILRYAEKGGKGLFLSAEIRIYLEDEPQTGPYFALAARRYTYNVQVSPVTSSSIVTPFLSRSEFGFTNSCYALHIGTQVVSNSKIRGVHDFFFGVGLRTLRYPMLEEVQSNGMNGGYYRKTNSTITSSSILLLFGYAFGIGF